jgi:Fe-S-cluster containining protein
MKIKNVQKAARERVVVVQSLIDSSEAYEALIMESKLYGLSPSCRDGCAACCTYVATVTGAEANLLAESIQRKPPDVSKQIVERLFSWERRWLRLIGNDAVGLPHNAILWQGERYACPMLDLTTNRCMVYSDRPISCRMHHAAVPPPNEKDDCGCAPAMPGEGCFQDEQSVKHGHFMSTWQMRPNLSQESFEILCRNLVKNGISPEIGILQLAVLDSGRRQFNWRAPKRIMKLDVLAKGVIGG